MLTENGRLKDYAAGEMLMNTGQNMRYTAIIVESLLKLYRDGEDGNEFFMYYLKQGHVPGLCL